MWWIIVAVPLVLGGGATAQLFRLAKQSQKMEARSSLIEGRFKPCPSSPNCRNSMGDPSDEGHYIAPFKYSVDRAQARQKIEEVIRAEKRTTIITNDPDHIHAEFKTAFIGFVDDVEIFMPADEALIHVRSASRVGHSDLGANRKRLEALRKAFGEGK